MAVLENATAECKYAAIEQWIILYTDELYAYAYRKTSDHELSKDLVQDTFLAALETAGSFEGRCNPKTWLTAILHHKIMDHFRKAFRRPILQLQDGDDPLQEHIVDDHLLDDPQFRMMLQQCIGLLPSCWQEVLRLRYLEAMDGKAICSRLKISLANYWQISCRARSCLRRFIKDRWLI